MKLTTEVVQVYLKRLVDNLLADARIHHPPETERDQLYANVRSLNEASRVVSDSCLECEVADEGAAR